MWFGDVDIPDEVITAHQDGHLVLFVGAGASIAPPSGLPTFVALARRIANESGVEFDAEDAKEPDLFLARLEDRVPVHQRVAAIIGDHASVPNALHRAIVALALTSPTPRIVTTNFDMHLSTALGATGATLREFHAPALPIGSAFDGLVYLHGSLRGLPGEMVITEADFGSAYLLESWASRFLDRMFREFVVVFIGYSHNDRVMSYLASSLGRSSLRYALTDDAQQGHWRRLHIHPIDYPAPGGDHEALTTALERWSERASMGMLGHDTKIGGLVAGHPSKVPEDVSYLEHVVEDPALARLFCKQTSGLDADLRSSWLDWVSTQPVFERMFSPPTPNVDPAAGAFARWFATEFALDEDHSHEALRLVYSRGGRLQPVLAHQIVLGARGFNDGLPKWVGPWLLLALDADPVVHDEFVSFLIHPAAPEDPNVSLTVIERLTTPRPLLGRPYGRHVAVGVMIGRTPSWEPLWTEITTRMLDTHALTLLALGDHQIRAAYRVIDIGGAYGDWDPLSSQRSAIEPHAQDRHHTEMTGLIDLARDALERVLHDAPTRGASYLDEWETSGLGLLIRLAAHGWSRRTDASPDQKLTWIRESGLLFDPTAKHEIFQVIQGALPDASSDEVSSLIEAVLAGLELDGEERYEAYNLLVWMSRSAPGDGQVNQALAEIGAAHPEWKPREHPDFDLWFSSGTWTRPDPFSKEALHTRLDTDPSGVIEEVLALPAEGVPIDQPTKQDGLAMLRDTINDDPRLGLSILQTPQVRDLPEIIEAVLDGWTRSTIDDVADDVIDLLATLDLDRYAPAISRLLAGSPDASTEAAAWKALPQTRALASELWIHVHADANADRDWLFASVNSSPGHLALFWVQSIAAEWTPQRDSWQSLPPAVEAALALLVDPDDERSKLAEVILASQVHFFMAADQRWTVEHLLPVLDWSNHDRATRAWSGFLGWGRWNDRLLRDGLLQQYLEAARNCHALPNEQVDRLWDHLADIALRSDLPLLGADGWLPSFIAAANDAEREAWVRAVGHLSRQLSPDAWQAQWERWMRHYWDHRLQGVPRPIGDSEASAMVSWTTRLGPHFTEAVARALQRPAELEQHSGLLRDFTKEVDAGSPPESVAALAAHVLIGTPTDRPFWHCDEIESLARSLRRADPAVDLQPLANAAMRLGCTPTDW